MSQTRRDRMNAARDENGDLAPPWAKYPTFERYCIGWRMGGGEDWVDMWWEFIGTLPTDQESRATYLRRHPPAPRSWADIAWMCLHGEGEGDEGEAEAQRRMNVLLQEGLVADDAAFQAWSEQEAVGDPWRWHGETAEEAVRYNTREFAFWSRKYGPTPTPEELPPGWSSVLPALTSGAVDVDPQRGLWTLAQMLLLNAVVPPWKLDLSPEDFSDSFDDDMGYVDAFHLWLMSAFDDASTANQLVGPVPAEWAGWWHAHTYW